MSEFESNSIDSSSNDTAVSDNASHSDNFVSENTTNSAPTNNIFVGKKPVMSYAMSGLIQLGQTGEIVIKGRGMVISRAVDVAQIITERLGKGKYSTKSIKIDTDVLGEDDNKRNVSTIEIIIGTS
tara:strand:- start:50741 stop:51118 length:378 start_codon:yes stop_codon:yes gene_type:complete